jgi:DNA-binding transcriptional LysR family regulator
MIDGLTLDQLRTFVAVVETGSFSAAGRRLRRVQSSISQSIQVLEQQLRVSIFDRSGRMPQLTDAGRVLLGDAVEVLAHADMLRARASSMASGVEAELAIAADSVLPSQPLAASLHAMQDVFPGLSVKLYTDVIGAAEKRLRDGDAQIGLYAFPLFPTAELEGYPLTEIPLIPVVSPSHPLAANRRPLARRDLEAHVQLILTDGRPEPPSVTNGVVSAKIWRFADLGRRLDFLLEGLGWGSMPVHMVSAHIATGRLVELPLADPETTLRQIPIYAVHLRAKPPGRAGRWLIDDLTTRLKTAP